MSAKYEEDRLDYLFKIVIVGDSGVGKTSLLLKYVDDVFTDTFISTIGVDFKIKTFELEGKKVKLQIWDTAGQDRFRNIVSTFYRNAHAILLVYDVTDMTTLDKMHHWLAEIEKYSRNAVKQVLVGNKSDLEDKRTVSPEYVNSLAEKRGMRHVETSAKTSHNVHALFSDLTQELIATVEPMHLDSHPTKLPNMVPTRTIGARSYCNC